MTNEKLRTDQFFRVANSATLHSSLFTFRSHCGQVALYLLAVLIAICVLMIMNVGIYLSVSAKNKAMNAGDAAALAAARHQGSLLNSIGQMNIDHLKAALEDDEFACQEIMTNQLRTCFLGPIDALAVDRGGFSYAYGCISAGNEAAKANGAKRSVKMQNALKEIANEIRNVYALDTTQYPEPWAGAWLEYAQRLDNAANAGIWAGPENISLPNRNSLHILLDSAFYNAVAGECWCWFKFNGYRGYLDSYNDFNDWPPLPQADDAEIRMRSVNSIVYSLHLQPWLGSAVALLGTNLICRLTEATASEVADSRLLRDPTQQWMLYDLNSWRDWWEIDPYGERRFPVVGQVKPEYNVRGSAVVCRTVVDAPNLMGGNDDEFLWKAAAKPFGTVENADGEIDRVTALGGFVIPSFDAVRLVPISAVVGGCGEFDGGAELVYVNHVLKHIPEYLATGKLLPAWSDGCWFCQQLVVWEKRSFRHRGSRWLQFHSDECVRSTGGSGNMQGGAPYAH